MHFTDHYHTQTNVLSDVASVEIPWPTTSCVSSICCPKIDPSKSWIQSYVRLYLRVKHLSGAYGQIFISARQVRVCWCEAPSLTRRRVDTISAEPRQRSSTGSSPWNSRPYFTVSDTRLSQSGGPDSRIYISQEQDGQIIPPGTSFSLCLLLRLSGLQWRYSKRLHTGTKTG
jgi:hypothetical protein